jgi:SNF2 family DNA or RNA helicase
MTTAKKLRQIYDNLPHHLRYLVQLSAVQYQEMNRTSLVELSAESGNQIAGREIKYADVQHDISDLVDKELFVVERHNKIAVNRLLGNAPLHGSIREGTFSQLVATVQAYQQGARWDRYQAPARSDIAARGVIAFYSGDLEEFSDVCRSYQFLQEASHGLCLPFEQDIFDSLSPELQEWLLLNVIHDAVALGKCADPLLLEVVTPYAMSQTTISLRLCSAWMGLMVAQADLDGLKQVSKRFGEQVEEAEACRAFLLGDYQKSLSLFDQAVVRLKGKSKKNRILDDLSGVLHVLLLIRENTPAATKTARGMINVAKKNWTDHFGCLLEALESVFKFRDENSDTETLFQSSDCGAPISLILESLMRVWYAPKSEQLIQQRDFESIAKNYKKLDLQWLVATVESLGAGKRLATTRKRANKWHLTHKIAPLADFIEPIPEWQLKLNALESMAPTTNKTQQSASTERMVWLLNLKDQYPTFQPVIQKQRKNGSWSAGRRVALERLHSGDEKLDFLTDHDQRVCRCIEQQSQSNWRSYRDVSYEFDIRATLNALIGHPQLYREGSEIPLELVQQQPKLVVSKQDRNNVVRMKLDPPANSESDVVFVEDTPQRITFVLIDDEYRKLAGIVGRFIDVPESASQQLLNVAQSLGAVATLHSDIASEQSEVQDGDEQLHLHLVPVQSGLRGELFVRPFTEHGPFLKPGTGAENIFAEFEGKPHTAKRNLTNEAQRVAELLNSSELLQQFQTDDKQFCTATADESLELMLELQTHVDAKRLALHWPRGESFRVAGQVSSANFQVTVKKDRDWFAASGTLQVDGELALDLMRLLELMDNSTSRFVKLDDGRFLVLTEQLRRQLDDLAAFGDRQKKKLRIPPVRAIALEDLDGVVSLKTDKHWQSHLQRIREAENLEPKVPSTLQAELRDYQVEGFEWMTRLAHWGVGACLADDMGLGKTLEALAVLLYRSSNGPALVIAPTSVTFNWLAEAARFAPTLNMHAFGTGDRDAIFENLAPRDVVVTSYGMLYTEAERFQSVEWNTVVLDEAQAIKNTATKRSQAAMGLQADMRIIMTGTPLENHLGELWNLFHFINPGLLGSFDSFRTRFAAPIEQRGCKEAKRRLKKLIQPFILRRTKSQVLQELPPRTEINLKVELSDDEATFYEALRLKALEKLEGSTEDAQPQHIRIFAELMRLRRACCHPKMVLADSKIESSKLKLFHETLDELLENRHKVLVFSQFVDHLSLIREGLDAKGVNYQYLDGSTPVKRRQQSVEAFQSGEGDVFLISLRAGGTGLNLTAADYVIHMDPWWNPAVEDQATDRAHRIGQLRPVTIYRLITSGTIEEKIVELHGTKRDLADSLLDGTDVSGKLSAQQLLNLIKET